MAIPKRCVRIRWQELMQFGEPQSSKETKTSSWVAGLELLRVMHLQGIALDGALKSIIPTISWIAMSISINTAMAFSHCLVSCHDRALARRTWAVRTSHAHRRKAISVGYARSFSRMSTRE